MNVSYFYLIYYQKTYVNAICHSRSVCRKTLLADSNRHSQGDILDARLRVRARRDATRSTDERGKKYKEREGRRHMDREHNKIYYA